MERNILRREPLWSIKALPESMLCMATGILKAGWGALKRVGRGQRGLRGSSIGEDAVGIPGYTAKPSIQCETRAGQESRLGRRAWDQSGQPAQQEEQALGCPCPQVLLAQRSSGQDQDA
jgi:hypothetical protein